MILVDANLLLSNNPPPEKAQSVMRSGSMPSVAALARR
jgi:hypothetical protein